jgi:hypothetical protein
MRGPSWQVGGEAGAPPTGGRDGGSGWAPQCVPHSTAPLWPLLRAPSEKGNEKIVIIGLPPNVICYFDNLCG